MPHSGRAWRRCVCLLRREARTLDACRRRCFCSLLRAPQGGHTARHLPLIALSARQIGRPSNSEQQGHPKKPTVSLPFPSHASLFFFSTRSHHQSDLDDARAAAAAAGPPSDFAAAATDVVSLCFLSVCVKGERCAFSLSAPLISHHPSSPHHHHSFISGPLHRRPGLLHPGDTGRLRRPGRHRLRSRARPHRGRGGRFCAGVQRARGVARARSCRWEWCVFVLRHSHRPPPRRGPHPG